MRSTVALALTVSFSPITTLQAQNRVPLQPRGLPRVVVVADNLTPQKARVLLMSALTLTRDPVELQAYFDR